MLMKCQKRKHQLLIVRAPTGSDGPDQLHLGPASTPLATGALFKLSPRKGLLVALHLALFPDLVWAVWFWWLLSAWDSPGYIVHFQLSGSVLCCP